MRTTIPTFDGDDGDDMPGNESTPMLTTPVASIGVPPNISTPTLTTPIASTGIPPDVSTPNSSARALDPYESVISSCSTPFCCG